MGVDRLGGIAMMLIWLGESLKKLEKYDGKLLLDAHPNIDWTGAKGMRDILSHNHGNVGAEVVFSVCTNNIPEVKAAIDLIKQELENSTYYVMLN